MVPGGFKHCPNMLNAVTLCIKILICTGMRLGEVLNLKIKNIEFEQNLFYIDIAKNDNQRIIPISQTLKEEILEYIEKTEYSANGRPLVTVEKSTQYAKQVHLTKKLNTVGSPL